MLFRSQQSAKLSFASVFAQFRTQVLNNIVGEVHVMMEYKSAQSFSWPAALASWLASFCCGSEGGGHGELVAGDGPTRQMAAAARHLNGPHKIRFS